MRYCSKLLVLLMIFVLSSCCDAGRCIDRYHRIYSTEVSHPFYEIVIPYAVTISKERRLRFADAELYYTDNKIQGLRVIFATQNIFELNNARLLLVDVVGGLLEALNNDERVVQAFGHTVEADDLEIYIAYESYFITYVDPMYIGWTSMIDGIVRYYNGVLKDPNKDYWGERIESYEQALEFATIWRDANGIN